MKIIEINRDDIADVMSDLTIMAIAFFCIFSYCAYAEAAEFFRHLDVDGWTVHTAIHAVASAIWVAMLYNLRNGLRVAALISIAAIFKVLNKFMS